MCHDNTEETFEHLFFDCSFAMSRWFSLGIVWDESANIHHKLLIASQVFGHPFFMEIFMKGAWCLWNKRNDLIFYGKIPNLASWKSAFKKVVCDHLIRIKQSMHASVRQWLDSL